MLRLASSVRQFSCTTPRPALPPLLVLMSKPLVRVVAVVAGKGARMWWARLPKDRRQQLRDKVTSHRRKIVLAGCAGTGGLVAAYESHVQECGVTGRRRFVALTPDQMKKISRSEFSQLLETLGPDLVPDTHPVYSRVSRVANRILAGNKDLRQIYDKNWTVTVVNQPDKNAFVLPSGNIFVFRGMLETLDNDDQLGIILGHEMAHTVLGHVAEKLTSASFVQLVLLLPLALLWAVLPNDGVAVVANWFVDRVVEVVLDLPFSRDMELEADQVGLQMAAKACFDVREAPVLWGKLEAMSDEPMETDKDFEFLSTHPVHSTRQESLTSQLSQALQMRTDCGCARLDSRKDPGVRLQEFKNYLARSKSDSSSVSAKP